MYANFLFVFTSLVVVAASALEFQDCGSSAEITDVIVQGCQKQPCKIIKGNTYKIQANFKLNAENPSTSFPFAITATVFQLPVVLAAGDVCHSLAYGQTCPLVVGQEYTFYTQIYASLLIPLVGSTKTTTTVRDQNGVSMACVNVNAFTSMI